MYLLSPKKHSHQQKKVRIECRISITITFIIRVPPCVLLDYAYCGIMVNNENGRRFVNGESTDMDIVLRDFELSCLLSLLFSFLYFQKFHPYMLCCRYSKIGSVQYFFFLIFFLFLFLPSLFGP